ncbi:MAG: hypothetical protein CV080_01855 [Candidatus Kuenenia stuttgartiensis]|nr:MAG: hypothetical protein CV080_01855 [Candidatus Kuenenia stuttgartiensis]
MFIKHLSDFYKRYLFALLIIVSVAIHGLFFFFSPQGNQLLSIRSLRDSFVREPDEFTITFDLESKDDKKELTASEVSKEKSLLEKEKKDKTFTDTSQNKEEEEPSAETDRIGEKGASAKGKNPDDTSVLNNEPYAGGQSKVPLLGKGEQGISIEDQRQNQAQKTVEKPGSKEERVAENNAARESRQTEKNPAPQKEQIDYIGMQQERVDVKEYKRVPSAGKADETDKTTTLTDTDGKELQKQTLAAEAGVRQERFPEKISRQEGIHVLEETRNIKNASKVEKGELLPEPQELQGIRKSEITKETGKERKDHVTTPPAGTYGVTQQNKRETTGESQKVVAEKEQPKASFNVAAKDEGSGNDPVLFEDTLSNAEIPGAPSFNVKQHKYAAYFKHIRQRISLYWFLGYGTRAEINLVTNKDKPIIIEFKVLPNGAIEGVKIVEDAGNFQLASRIVSSIKSASPLDPFPSHIKESSINVKFNFYFF